MKMYIVWIIIVILILSIGLPAVAGIWTILTENGKAVISPSASIGLAILSTALSGVILWFVKNPLGNSGYSPAIYKQRSFLEYAGKLLLFAAFWFAILGVLAPVIPSPESNLAPMEIVIKYVAFGALMLSSASLIVAVCMGIVLVWVRKF